MTAPLDAGVFDLRCSHRMPIRVGDKWSGLILRCLEDGGRRFGEVKAALRGVAPKVLTETLRAMERDGWVTRTAYDENPPRVEYALTELGRSLLGPLNAACAWAREHLDELPHAQERTPTA
ncbi:winged helix-turn-helix transcriptional regulator [Peterkaempfera griseoplana]|uniref:winged helix-turn-helix transcriptional regulator n=1 Tax=Peterkaempfera griseoplana TaxID=66896 RepID=UPI0006E1EF62|nr:helix-turn-helix domain-containing protein [Peterkaempfera griseoplana]